MEISTKKYTGADVKAHFAKYTGKKFNLIKNVIECYYTFTFDNENIYLMSFLAIEIGERELPAISGRISLLSKSYQSAES